MMKATRLELLIGVFLSVGTLATFWPVLQNGFVNYEDTLYITQNPHVLGGLGLGNVGWAFGTAYYDYWHPLAWLSHMLDMELFGLNPAWHHLTSLVLHVANTLLLFWVLRWMTGAVWRSACAAALFAVHPLHVESVAWVTERKDVLSTCFFMLTLWAYMRYVGESRVLSPESRVHSPQSTVHNPQLTVPGADDTLHAPRSTLHASRFTHHVSRFYLLSLLFFACGLMSKPMLVTVPFVLLLLDYWPLGRFRSPESTVLSSDPEVQSPQSAVQSLPPAAIHRSPQPSVHGLRSVLTVPQRRFTFHVGVRLLVEKIPFAALALAVSAATFVIQRRVGAMETLASVGFGERLANALVSYMRYLGKMLWPARLAVFYPHPLTLPAWEWVAAAIALTGFTLIALQHARSRPYMLTGWFWFLGTLVPVIGLVQVGEQAMADRYTYVPLIGLFIIVVWGGFDVAAQWRHGVAATAVAGAWVLVALGTQAHIQATFWRTSATLFAHAIAVTDNNAVAHNNLGTALADEDDWVEAGKHFSEALRLRPTLQMARINCALALANQDKAEEATREIADVTQGVGAAGHRVLGDIFRGQGKTNEAIQQYAAAVKLKPDDPAARNSLGQLLAREGKTVEAGVQFAELVRTNPDGEAHYHLALCLVILGQPLAAIEHYREAVRLKPDWPEPLNDLAWLLATCSKPELRNGVEAVGLAERACQLSGHREARFLGTLDAAYAEAGRLGEAMAVAEEARKLALVAGDQGLADAAAARLALYKSGRPYHQP